MMAMLPQINPDEFESWRRKADERIKFLVLFSDRFTNERLPTAKALTHAAELALASNQVSYGCDLMERALNVALEGEPAKWPMMRVIILGALMRRVDTFLEMSGIKLQIGSKKHEAPWLGSISTMHRAAGSLLAAATCSSFLPIALNLLFSRSEDAPDATSRIAFFALTKALDADTLPDFGFGRRDDGGLNSSIRHDEISAARVAFAALHLQYAARLRLLASDQAHWRELRPRAPLIDWALLGLHVAAIRHGTRIANEIQEQRLSRGAPIVPTLDFIHSLASDIVQRYPN